MKKKNPFQLVTPRIVRAGSQTTITITPLFDHVRFNDQQTYLATLIPSEGLPDETAWPVDKKIPLTPEDGLLKVPCNFANEQEYLLLIETTHQNKLRPLAEFRLYALEDDLYQRRPYKGDMHIHSYYSDGKEAQAYVAGACRRIGLDYLAVTDHGRYTPSLEAVRAFADLDVDLRVFPGEEVHPPDNRVHMVNFGGNFSVNELFSTESYRAEVQAIADTLVDLPSGVDRYPYASCVWCFDKIRRAGGLGIYAHPYWFSEKRYDLPQTLASLVYERQPYDALELIGGYFRFEIESNVLQYARYNEERLRGKRIPIVGVSDAHGCEVGELFGWGYTVVFSPSLELPDLIRSIKDLYSVAIEALPEQTPRPCGPFRLVKYCQFLLREVFPQHDELCQEEGRLMLAHLAGDQQAAGLLSAYKGRTAIYYDQLWGKEVIKYR